MLDSTNSLFAARADGLKLWATEGAPPAEVAECLVARDRDALMWHAAGLVLDAAQVAHIERTAAALMAGGYEFPGH